MTDIDALRRDLAADPGNQSLRAAVSRLEARGGIKGKGFVLMALSTTGFPNSDFWGERHRRKWRIAERIEMDFSGERERIWHFTHCGRLMIGRFESWWRGKLPEKYSGSQRNGLGLHWGHRQQDMLARPELATCIRCRKALGLGAHEEAK